MKIASKKDIIWLSVVLLITAGAKYAWELNKRENIVFYCGRKGVIFPSPVPAIILYDVVFYNRICDMDDYIFSEIRLRSKDPPYKQKTVLRYDSRHDLDDAARIPEIRWLSPHDLEISPGFIDDIEYRYNKIRDINIHYNIKKIKYPGVNDAGSTDPWEWLGFGWHVVTNKSNVDYTIKPVK